MLLHSVTDSIVTCQQLIISSIVDSNCQYPDIERTV